MNPNEWPQVAHLRANKAPQFTNTSFSPQQEVTTDGTGTGGVDCTPGLLTTYPFLSDILPSQKNKILLYKAKPLPRLGGGWLDGVLS